MVIRSSGSKELKWVRIKSSNPLKTDKTMIKAMVPTVMQATEIHDMIFIALCDFLANRYRLAM
jgi:hypothetical protein